MYQVTVSTEAPAVHPLREVGQYPSLKDAIKAAEQAVNAALKCTDWYVNIDHDSDYIGCEDWLCYVNGDKSQNRASKAVCVAINQLPLMKLPVGENNLPRGIDLPELTHD